MARVAVLSGATILDTSWLLELYRVPGHFTESRMPLVRNETRQLIDSGYGQFVTVPVLFEVASHITRAPDGNRRRALSKKYRDDIRTSIDHESPWTIVSFGTDILFRPHDVLQLAERFLESSGPNYSFADISIIDLAAELRRSGRTVKILAFDPQLKSYSD